MAGSGSSDRPIRLGHDFADFISPQPTGPRPASVLGIRAIASSITHLPTSRRRRQPLSGPALPRGCSQKGLRGILGLQKITVRNQSALARKSAF